ncbi:MAG: LysR family transcriptional regulator [Atopobiaceae bacterium]|nr:LysR family transcriptional regulator [Atopobiaceae bacterium]
MELDQLRQLLAVERCGTISAAAEECHLTQPSLSRSMRRLEAELGMELFVRTRNSVELNDAGRVACEHARDVLSAESRMRDAMDELAQRRRTLRVGAIAPAPIWNLTARIVERFPGTILAPEMLSDAEIDRRLFDRTIDLAITRRPMALPNCRCVPLMTENLFLYAPEGHPLAGRPSVSFADMEGETFLVMEQLGFWREVYEGSIPGVQSIRQADREVFLQLVKSSDLLCFTTDAPQHRGGIEGRVAVPISDASAHATFFLVALREAVPRVGEIVDWVERER